MLHIQRLSLKESRPPQKPGVERDHRFLFFVVHSRFVKVVNKNKKNVNIARLGRSMQTPSLTLCHFFQLLHQCHQHHILQTKSRMTPTDLDNVNALGMHKLAKESSMYEP